MTDETTARDRLAEWAINGGPYNAKDLRRDVAEVLRALSGAPTADVAEELAEWRAYDAAMRKRCLETMDPLLIENTLKNLESNLYHLRTRIAAAAPEGVDAGRHPRVAGRCPSCRASTSLFLGAGGHVTCSRLDCPAPGAVDDQLHAVSEDEPEGMDLEAQGEMADRLAAAQAAIQRLAQAGDALMGAARSLAYAWETDTPDRVMWAEWKKVGPAIEGWVTARRALDGDTTEEA